MKGHTDMNALLPLLMSALSLFHPATTGVANASEASGGPIFKQSATAGGTNGGPIFKKSTIAGGTNGGPIFKKSTTAGGTNGGPIFKH